MRLAYHVRVLVPCYREELEIVARTVLAALAADLPASCARTVYLCDDGKARRPGADAAGCIVAGITTSGIFRAWAHTSLFLFFSSVHAAWQLGPHAPARRAQGSAGPRAAAREWAGLQGDIVPGSRRRLTGFDLSLALTLPYSAQDPEKRKWVEGLRGEDVVYVSGRARPPGEMNGKSGNLNFCASQLYPKARPRLPACARRLARQARACCASWSAC